MVLHNNFPLGRLNTFGVSAIASALLILEHENDLSAMQPKLSGEWMMLGSGSNLLFTRDYCGTLIKPGFEGIEVLGNVDGDVLIRAGAGVVWDDFVGWCVLNRYYGLENLSDIPGSVGAAPVQNIGAYGVEVKDFIERVEGYELPSGKYMSYEKDECAFRYRNSYFKSVLKNSFLVSQVVFRLSKVAKLETSYGAVANELAMQGSATPIEMRNAIKRIRRSKLPFPEQLGNAGSFFKNPVVATSAYEALKANFGEVPGYLQPDGFKIPAAWLIEKAGLKSFSKGHVATHHLQPLVIVNLGGASGQEIADFSKLIQEKVEKQFGVKLEPEVQII